MTPTANMGSVLVLFAQAGGIGATVCFTVYMQEIPYFQTILFLGKHIWLAVVTLGKILCHRCAALSSLARSVFVLVIATALASSSYTAGRCMVQCLACRIHDYARR